MWPANGVPGGADHHVGDGYRTQLAHMQIIVVYWQARCRMNGAEVRKNILRCYLNSEVQRKVFKKVDSGEKNLS